MKIYGAEVEGIRGRLIRFGATMEPGSGVSPLGLAGKVVKEGYIRAIKAIERLDESWHIHNFKVTIQMKPAATPKISEGLDLPIAITLLQASLLQDVVKLEEQIKLLQQKADKDTDNEKRGNERKRILEQIEQLIDQRKKIIKYKKIISENNTKYLLIGTLDITTGEIEPPLYGMLSLLSAADNTFNVIVPEQSEIHAALIRSRKGYKVYKAKNLNEVWNILLKISEPRRVQYSESRVKPKDVGYIPDLNAINGMSKAKEALKVAIAGGHNILFVGPSGQGKSMLAKAAIKLLPDLDENEKFDINLIYSAKGQLEENEVITKRPYREVNKGITGPALFGGGNPPIPGEISLAHKGILLFDEINLFKTDLLEDLRTPLDYERHFTVRRVHGTIKYPCNFIMIAAMNPCKCGWYRHLKCPACGRIYINKSQCNIDGQILVSKCNCTSAQVSSYRDKLSKPLRDRIDLKVLLSSYDRTKIIDHKYSSQTIRKEIEQARIIQQKRFSGIEHIKCNADISDISQYMKYDNVDTATRVYFSKITRKIEITFRQITKLLLVSRTIADLECSKMIKPKHIDRGILLMSLNDQYFKE